MDKIWGLIKSPSFMAVLTIVAFGTAIYQGFFYERKGELSITVTPPAKVLDIHKAVGGLEVSYAGQNLREAEKTLWVIAATIRNIGNAGIRKADFDEQDLLGIEIKEGEIVDTPSLRSNTEYLQRNLKLITSNRYVKISPVIIEPGNTMSISFLVLGDEHSKPELSVVGKISGIVDPEISGIDEDEKFSVWKSIAHVEKWWVHFIRSAFYVTATILASLVTAAILSAFMIPINAYRDGRKKAISRGKIDNYKKGESLTREARSLIQYYLEFGPYRLGSIYNAIVNLEKRIVLKDKIAECLDVEEVMHVCFKSYPIPNSVKSELTKRLGVEIDDQMDLDQLAKWKSELKSLADHLGVKLDYRSDLRDVFISPELESRLSPQALARINEQIESATDLMN